LTTDPKHLSSHPLRPKRIERTGDPTPASGIWAYTWRMTGYHQVAAGVLAVIVAMLNLVPVDLQRRIIDDGISRGDTALLFTLAALYGGVLFGHQALKFVLKIYQRWLAESTVFYTRQHLLSILTGRGGGGDEETGEAVAIIGREVDKLGEFTGQSPSDACANIAKFVGILGYMVAVEPQIALLSAALIAPQALLVPVIQRRLNKLIERRLGLLRALGSAITRSDSGVSGSSGPGGDSADSYVSPLYNNRIRFFLWKFTMKGLLNLLNSMAPLAILIYGGWLAVNGETTIGVIVAFLSGFERLSGPISELIAFYRTVAQAGVQHDMIAKWM
jgi:ABC-type bacteriocin/lantibiotic exporter with double-glycine peptidase domain